MKLIMNRHIYSYICPRILCTLCIFRICCCLTAANVFYDERLKFEVGQIAFYNENNTYQDSVAFVAYNDRLQYSDNMPKELIIPGYVELNGRKYNVVISENAFRNCPSFEKIIIQEGALQIHEYAFYGCNNLHSVEIPQSVNLIHRSAFRRCNSLTTIKVAEGNEFYDSRENCNAIISVALIIGCKGTKIPSDINYIEYEAFNECEGLDSIIIPEGITYISGLAFKNCKNLRKVTLPKSLETLCGSAFGNCTALKEIYIPKNVNTINGNPFSGCIGLNKIVVDRQNRKYDSGNNCNGIIETASKKLISAGMITSIPKETKELGMCFYGIPIQKINISKRITKINPLAFVDCKNLVSISVNKKNPVYDSRNDCNAIIEKGSNTLIAGCYNTRIPEDVIEIGASAFEGRTLPATLNIPYGLERIRSGAFRDCSGLKQIKIPFSVDYMTNEIFSSCPNLENVIFDAFVNEIGLNTFRDCIKLNNINIPNNIKIIAHGAFSGCIRLQNITIPEYTKIIEQGAFDGCPCETDVMKRFQNK